MSALVPPQRLLEGGAIDADDARLTALLRQAPAQIPDDPLADRKLLRVLMQQLPSRPPTRGWTPVRLAQVAACATVVIGLTVLWLNAPQPAPLMASVTLAQGGVLWETPAGDWAEAPVGAALSAGAELRTEGSGQAIVALPRARILLPGGSDVGLASLDRALLLRLRRGEVVASVDPRRAGETFVVQTARYRVTVKGTIFSVHERSADDVEVSVQRGLVEVTGNDGRWLVPAGHSWRSRVSAAPGEPEAPEEITPDQLRLLGETAGDAEAAPPAAAHEAVRPLPTGTADTGEKPAPLANLTGASRPMARPANPPEPTVDDAPKSPRPPPSMAPPPVILARIEPDETQARPTPTPLPVAPAVPPVVLAQPPPAATADATTAALQLAQRDPKAGGLALETLAHQHREHADLALYELGRLRARQGDAAGALAAYATYAHDYPQGALAQEAAISTIEIELQQAKLPAALADIDRFLGRYGHSERAPEIHLRRGDVLRQQGDDTGALAEYLVADHAGPPPVVEEALYRAAACDGRLGRSSETNRLLAEYLLRFPHGAHVAEAAAAVGSKF